MNDDLNENDLNENENNENIDDIDNIYKIDLSNALLNPLNHQLKRKKILFIGKQKSGKSAIIFRYKENFFIETYEPTIQNLTKKIITLKKDLYEIEIVDIAGQSEFTLFTYNTYAMGINGYFLVYSIDDKSSFILIKKLNEKLDSLVGKNVPKILIGTKNDENEKREVSFEEGINFAKQLNCPFFECSSKSGENINKSFQKLLVEIIKKEVNFDEKKIFPLFLFKFFVAKENFFRLIYYILMIFNIMFPILITIILCLKTCPINKFLLLLSNFIWVIILSIISIYGLYHKNCIILKIINIAYLMSILFQIGIKIYCYFTNFPNDSTKIKFLFFENFNLNYVYGPLLTIYLIFSFFCLFFSQIFTKIYKDELDLFLL